LIIRILAEEHLVTERYPEYIEYAKRTKRIIPFYCDSHGIHTDIFSTTKMRYFGADALAAPQPK